MKDVSKMLRLEYLQYQELLQMTQLRSGGISKESEQKLKRGEALSHLLTQYKHRPISVPEQIFCLIALSNGLLDGLPAEDVKKYRADIQAFVAAEDQKLLEELQTTRKITDASKDKFLRIIQHYFQARAEKS